MRYPPLSPPSDAGLEALDLSSTDPIRTAEGERAGLLALRREAEMAGDFEQVAICNAALHGSTRAIRECRRVCFR